MTSRIHNDKILIFTEEMYTRPIEDVRGYVFSDEYYKHVRELLDGLCKKYGYDYNNFINDLLQYDKR